MWKKGEKEVGGKQKGRDTETEHKQETMPLNLNFQIKFEFKNVFRI